MIHQLSINYIVREEPQGDSTVSVLSGFKSSPARHPNDARKDLSPELIPNLDLESCDSRKSFCGVQRINSFGFAPGKIGLPNMEFSFEDAGLPSEGKNDESETIEQKTLETQKCEIEVRNFSEFSMGSEEETGVRVEMTKNQKSVFGMNFGKGDLSHVLTSQELKTPGKLQMKALYDEKTDVTRNMDQKGLFCREEETGSYNTQPESPVLKARKTGVKKSRFSKEKELGLENLQFLGNMGFEFTPNSFLTPVDIKNRKLEESPKLAENFENELDLAQFDMIQDLEFESLVGPQDKANKEQSEYQLEDFELEDEAESFDAPSVCVEDYILPSQSDLSSTSSIQSSEASSITSQSEAAQTEFSEEPAFTQSLIWERENIATEEKEFVTSLEMAIDTPQTSNDNFSRAQREMLEILDFTGGFKSPEELNTMEEQLDTLFGLKEDALALTVNCAINERVQKEKLREKFAYVGVGLDYDYLEALEEEISVVLDDETGISCGGHRLVILRAGVVVEAFETEEEEISEKPERKDGKSLKLVEELNHKLQFEVITEEEFSTISNDGIEPVNFLRIQKEEEKLRHLGELENVNENENTKIEDQANAARLTESENTDHPLLTSNNLDTRKTSCFHCTPRKTPKFDPDKCRCKEPPNHTTNQQLNPKTFICDEISKTLSDAINKSDLERVLSILLREMGSGENSLNKSEKRSILKIKRGLPCNFEIKSVRAPLEIKNRIRLEISMPNKTNVMNENARSATTKKLIWVDLGFEGKNATPDDFPENLMIAGVMKTVRKMITQSADHVSSMERVCLKIENPIAQGRE